MNQKKDSENDWRAAVRFLPAWIHTFPATLAGGARPDPVVNQYTEQLRHWDADADMVFVEVLHGFAGLTRKLNSPDMIIEWDNVPAQLHETIAHEMGHSVGLEHEGHRPPHVMAAVPPAGTNVELTRQDADAFD